MLYYIIMSISTAPTAPIGLTVAQSSATQLYVSWSRPIPSNGVINRYTLDCSGSGEQYYSDQMVPGPFMMDYGGEMTSAVLSNLLPFTNYTCTISATTGAGEGDMSDPVTQATDESSKL